MKKQKKQKVSDFTTWKTEKSFQLNNISGMKLQIFSS